MMRYSLARLIFIAHGYLAFKQVTGQYFLLQKYNFRYTSGFKFKHKSLKL